MHNHVRVRDVGFLVNNHIGPPMVVHDLIRDYPDFIKNKITINWISSLLDLAD